MPNSRDKNASIQRLCGVSHAEALRRGRIAAVCATFPLALELLGAGKISAEHLLALAPAMKHDMAGPLLEDAVGQCPEDFRDTVRQFQLGVEHGTDTAKRQNAQRFLRFTDGADGMVGFHGSLPPLSGATLKATLASMVDAKWREDHPERARTEGGHGGDSHEQRMADALLELILSRPNLMVNVDTGNVGTENESECGASSPESANPAAKVGTTTSRVRPVKPSVIININVEKWEAELIGTGPVPITPSLFDLAKNDLYYAFTNMPSEVLKFGRARKYPSPLQRLAVIARDRNCIYPGCTITADLCEIHHLNEWLQDQGFTDVEILGLLCRPHHRHIHTNNLKVIKKPDGTVNIHERDGGLLIATARPANQHAHAA